MTSLPGAAEETDEDEAENDALPTPVLTSPASSNAQTQKPPPPVMREDSDDSTPLKSKSGLSAQTTRSTDLENYQVNLSGPGFSGQTLALETTWSRLSDGSITRQLSASSQYEWREDHSWSMGGAYALNPDDVRSWSVSPSIHFPLHPHESWATRLQLAPEFERLEQTLVGKRGRSQSLGTTSLGGTVGIEQDLGDSLEIQASFEKKIFLGTVPGKLGKIRRSSTALISGLPTQVLTLGATWQLTERWTLQGEASRTTAVVDSVENELETSLSYSLSLKWALLDSLAFSAAATQFQPEDSSATFQSTLGATLSW